jgi:uncharacterized surface protein with fasciclin (FAS1) repeats
MKLSIQTTTTATVLAVAAAAGAAMTMSASSVVTAFAPVTSKSTPKSTSKSTTTTSQLMANPSIWSTMGSLEGPSVCWGPEGVIIGHEEIEIKEYDNFSMFRSALDQCGLANELRGLGPFTLLLPTDSAVCAHTGILDEETLRYHIIKGDIYSDELEGQLETLNPNHTLCAKQEFRKAYVDDGKFLRLWGSTYVLPTFILNIIIISFLNYFFCLCLFCFIYLIFCEFEFFLSDGRFMHQSKSNLTSSVLLLSFLLSLIQ